MRAFDPASVLSEQPDRVDGDLAERLGRTIARFHAGAEVRPEGGGASALGFTIRTNADNLRLFAGDLGAAEVRHVIEATDAALAAATPLLEARRAAGFARRCHGDLHLGNILLEDGRPVLFDCIEFNDLLSEIDVLYDVAFPVMDLAFRGRVGAASRLLCAWLDESARGLPPTLWDGLAAFPLMLSARAAVRCHVMAHQGDLDAARTYIAAAARHLASPSPTLTAVGGLSGTGKTTLARRIAPGLGAAPGAVVLRSDEIRKRLAGAAPIDRLPASAYAPDMSARVYDEMLALARSLLAAGRAVVLDAVFLRPDERRAAARVAEAIGVPFHGTWLEGRREMLDERLAVRAGDASDAGPATLAEQLTRDAGPIDWDIADAADVDGLAARLAPGAPEN